MLVFHVSVEQCHRQMPSTVLILDSVVLPFAQGDELLSTIDIHFSEVRCPYLPQNKNHGDHFDRARVVVDSFEQLDQDVKQKLQ